MKWEMFRKRAEELLEEKRDNEREQAKLGGDTGRLRDVLERMGGVDEGIRRAIGAAGSALYEQKRAAEFQMEMIMERRGELKGELESDLSAVRRIMENLEKPEAVRYESHFAAAKRAAQRAESEISELLEMIGERMERPAAGGGLISEFRQEEQLQREIRTKLQAVSMLISMTPVQREAVLHYTSQGYAQINAVLRGRAQGFDSERTREMCRQLHALLAGQHTQTPITVYRAINTDGLGPLSTLGDDELVGKKLIDGAFVSTSLREEAVMPGKSVMLVLDLPAGCRGAYIGGDQRPEA